VGEHGYVKHAFRGVVSSFGLGRPMVPIGRDGYARRWISLVYRQLIILLDMVRWEGYSRASSLTGGPPSHFVLWRDSLLCGARKKHAILRNEPTVLRRHLRCNCQWILELRWKVPKELGGFVFQNEPKIGGKRGLGTELGVEIAAKTALRCISCA
jgi:hypothetical protein